MFDKRYEVKFSPDFETFEFISTGPKGNIIKTVNYTKIYSDESYYNLGFGDKDPITGFVSDIITTNNNDSQKVLATVASTLIRFMDAHPDAIVVATGSTESRIRLYRMGISNHYLLSKTIFLFLD